MSEQRYSKVTRRVWNDAAFNRLTPMKPSGQALFLRLLTGPELTNIPGLFQAWDAGFAQSLGWSAKGFDRSVKELLKESLIRRDGRTGLWWLPKAIRHNEPASPNVVKSWKATWDELPECELKSEAEAGLVEWARQKDADSGSEAWSKAFAMVIGKPFGKASAKTCPNQDQDQEQEQEQEQDLPQTPSSLSLRSRATKWLEGGLSARDIGFASGEPHQWPEVREVFADWTTVTGRSLDVRITDKRAKAVAQWLAAGYTRAEIREVFERAQRDDWWQTRPLEVVLGDTSRLDALRQAAGDPAAPPESAAEAAAAEKRILARRAAKVAYNLAEAKRLGLHIGPPQSLDELTRRIG